MLELNPANQNGIVGAGVTADALKASGTEVVPTADDRQLNRYGPIGTDGDWDRPSSREGSVPVPESVGA